MPTVPEAFRDLLDGRIAVLTTIGPDGRPQVSPVWFLAEGDTLRFSLNDSRQKVRNLRADPKATVLLLDLANPYRYLELRGDVEIEADPDYAFADRVGARYDADLRVHDQPGQSRVVVTLRATKVNAVDMRGG